MKRVYMVGVVVAACVWVVTSGEAADASRGQKLHDPKCMTECHATKANGAAKDLYTRKNRLDSLEKLKGKISVCNQQLLNTEWWPEDEADVVEYLNNTFYQFK